jgi:hypothetical protein
MLWSARRDPARHLVPRERFEGTLQGVSRRGPGRSRPQELDRYVLSRRPYGQTRQPEG